MEQQVSTYYSRLQDVRQQVETLAAGLTQAELNYRPGPDFNSIGILLQHLAGAERYWFGEVLGGHPADRDRAAEFVGDEFELSPLLEQLRAARTLTASVLETLPDAALREVIPCRSGSGREIRLSREWIITHHIEHEYQHYGHMQMLVKLSRMGREG